MTRDLTKLFLAVLVAVFVGEHILIVYDATTHSPPTVDPAIISCRVVK